MPVRQMDIPDAIYMYGWSWAPLQPSGTCSKAGNQKSALPLVRVGDSFCL